MKKKTRNTLQFIFSLALAFSLCMSLLTPMAKADEATDDPPVNIELILPITDTSAEPDLDNAKMDAQASEDTDDESIAATTNDAADEAAEEPEENSTDDTEAPAEDSMEDESSADEFDTDVSDSNDIEDASEDKTEGPEDEDIEPDISVSDNQSEEIAETGASDEQPDKGTKVDESPTVETLNQYNEDEITYSDKGVTSDGLDWELTKDAVTGKYTLTIVFKNDPESGALNLTEGDLSKVEQYASEISAALAEKYGVAWEWDSTAAPSGGDNVQMFQVFLTGNGDKDHTYRYDADKLEQMDGEFTLEKVDEYGNLITGSEATFQLWHINEITDPVTSEKVEVKMFCSYDPETNTYTFIPTESTIQTINGRLEILYAMMKDTVYFLQEVQAPAGYDVDPFIHIIMEKDVWEAEDESFRNQFRYLGEFTEDENGRIGLDVKFVDVKTGAGDLVSEVVPTPAAGPDIDPAPMSMDKPDDNIPDPDPTPITDEIPNPEINPDPPAENDSVTEPRPEEPVPTPVSINDIPKTGDMMSGYVLAAITSAIGLIVVSCSGRRKAKQ